MMAAFIQEHIHRQWKRKVLSESEKGFAERIQGWVEHAVITRADIICQNGEERPITRWVMQIPSGVVSDVADRTPAGPTGANVF
jgi:hypothetical protein